MSKEEVYIATSKWAQEVKQSLGAENIYVFGSLIHRDGEQFEAESSDIDLVVEIPTKIRSEVEIVEWLENLKQQKQKLEQTLFILLKRNDPNDPIVSVLPVTKEELYFDIHKSKAPSFFSGNKFKCLFTDIVHDGIEGAKKKDIENDLVRQVIEFCQKNRNEFLSNTIHSDLRLLEWKVDDDVLPKALMRHSAMISDEAVSDPNGDQKFDLQIGLDHIYNSVYLRRHENARFKELHNWISVRRRARGDKDKIESLSQISHLFLSEVIFSLATNLKETSIERHELSNKSAQNGKEVEIVDIEAEAAEIIVTGEGDIPLSDEELGAFIEQAVVNMKWKLEPYFVIRIPELIDLNAKLADFDAQSVKEKSERAHLFDRYNRLKHIKKELEKGISIHIWYQNYLFNSDDSRKECLNASVRQFCKLCYELSLIRASRVGGLLVCYHTTSYSEFGTFGFSIPEKDREAFFKENKIEDIMHLAAENRFVDDLPPEVYSLHFTPLLVKHGVDRILKDEIKEDSLAEGMFFNVNAWKFGVK